MSDPVLPDYEKLSGLSRNGPQCRRYKLTANKALISRKTDLVISGGWYTFCKDGLELEAVI